MGGNADSRSFCEGILPRVSRTFALGIAGLPDDLRTATTTAYLLCRIADAFEDETSAPIDARRRALVAWRRDVVEVASRGGERSLGVPRALVPVLPDVGDEGSYDPRLRGTSEADRELVEKRDLVLEAFAREPADVRRVVAARVAEMAGGMAAMLQDEGTHPIQSLEDLDAYCHFVAGTVGHVLNALFLAGVDVDAERVAALDRDAPRFGIGLQLVNVVKDAAGDLRDGRCFVPRELWPAALPYAKLPDDGAREALRKPLLTLVGRARTFLADAQRYLVSLPAEAIAARRFCAFPLHLAVLTLEACRRSPDLVDPDRPVKVSRAEVTEAAAWVLAHAADDVALAARFDELTRC